MKKITKEKILEIAHNQNFDIDQNLLEEIYQLFNNKLLKDFASLSELDVKDLPMMEYGANSSFNTLRKDEPVSYKQEDVLKNSKNRVKDLIEVK